MFFNSTWGTVCEDRWDWSIFDAAVVCKELGFPGALKAVDNAFFGQGSGVIWLSEVACSYRGSEESLRWCDHQGWGKSICGHGEDVGVICERKSLC